MRKKDIATPDLAKPKSSMGYPWAIIVGILGFLLYANTIGNGYVLDDDVAIIKNLFVQEGLSGIPKLFTIDFWYFENLKLGYYRPLGLVSFAIEHEFFGNNPYISHLNNALLYGLTGFILCLSLMNFMRSKHPAIPFFISLLFLAHPIHTEVVANIKSRDEILSFLNMFAMLFCVLQYQKLKKKSLFIWSLIFFYLALISKETAVVGLVLLPLFLYYSGNTIPAALKNTIPYAGIAVLFFLQKRYFLGSQSVIIYNDIVNYPYASAQVKIPSMFHLFALCLSKLAFPWPLSYDYSYNQIPASHWTDGGAWLGLILFIGLASLVTWGVFRKTIWGLGLAIIFITLIPSVAFVFLKGGIMAERFLYAPCLGFAILIIYALSFGFSKSENISMSPITWFKNNILFTGILVLICLGYSIETTGRNRIWKDQLTLFANDAKYAPNSCLVRKLYGSALLDEGRLEKDSAKRKRDFESGMSELQKAIEIAPEFGQTYFEVGLGYSVVEVNMDSALKYYKKCIEITPGNAKAYDNMGIIYARMDNLPMASYYFNKSVEVNPQFQDGIKNAANIKKTSGLDVHVFPGDGTKIARDTIGNKDLAINSQDKVKNFNLYSLKGTAAFDKGDYITSIKYFKKAAEFLPDIEGNLIHLGNSYVMAKRYKDAIKSYELVLIKHPDNQIALKNIALSYEAMGQTAKATEIRKKLK